MDYGNVESFEAKIIESVKKAKRKINDLRKEETLVFPLFSDLHTDGKGHEFANRLNFALKSITEEIECDGIINLGDNFSMLGRRIHITNDELKKKFEELFSDIYSSTKLPVINVNGNHDAIGTDFFKSDFWNDIVKEKYGNKNAVYGDEGSYYYVDFEKSNTRFVILSLPYDSDIESQMPTPLWRFGKSQLEWLKNIALDTKNNVIILSHVPFFYKYMGDKQETMKVWDGKNEKLSYIFSLCGEIEDIDEASKIINDFANLPETKLVAVLSGHIHEDDMWLPFEQRGKHKNPLSCKQIVTRGTCIGVRQEPQTGISVDVLIYTPKEEVNFVRIGDGADRNL